MTRSGRVLGDDLERLGAVARLRHDLDAGNLAEEEAQLLPRQLLVVHDHGAKHVGWSSVQAGIRAGTTSSGMTMRAHVPSPGTLSSCS